MNRVLRYEAETGASADEARRVVLGGHQPRKRPAPFEEREIPHDPHYRGNDQAAADAWGRSQDEERRRQVKEAKDKRKQMFDMSNRWAHPSLSLVLPCKCRSAERHTASKVQSRS